VAAHDLVQAGGRRPRAPSRHVRGDIRFVPQPREPVEGAPSLTGLPSRLVVRRRHEDRDGHGRRRQAPARREQVARERQLVPAGLVVLSADDDGLAGGSPVSSGALWGTRRPDEAITQTG